MTSDDNTEALESRLTALEQHSAVLEERIQYRAAERAADYLQLSKLVDQAVDLRVDVRVLQTRLAIYAALGSFVGGGLISLVVNVLYDVLHH